MLQKIWYFSDQL